MTQQRLYNPALLGDEELKTSFVVRKRELNELLRLLREQPENSPLHHALIIGSRGTGKTTLGLRLLLAVRESSSLRKSWQPVPYYEESYGIADLAGLWLTALRHLSYATGDDQWARRADNLVKEERDSERLAANALAALIDFRKESGKRPILFVENLDEVFAQFHDPHDMARLRSVLQERFDFLLIGTANSVFEAITSRGKPFYEFFRQVQLNGLGQEETLAFLEMFAARQKNDEMTRVINGDPGRIEVIRRFTGGNPRLIGLTARLIAESPTGAAWDDLERLIDEQTPYFKARIDLLSHQLRSVFHALAEGWAPMLAREVAAKGRMSSSQASAQLNKLKNLGYVEELREPDRRLLRYQVFERFYNIYYLVRFTRDQRLRLERLIDFIVQMFGSRAVIGMAQATLTRLRQQTDTGRKEWVTLEILAPRLANGSDQVDQQAIFREALRLGNEQGVELPELLQHGWQAALNDPPSLMTYIKSARRYLDSHPDRPIVWAYLATAHVQRDEWTKAVRALDKVIELSPPAMELFIARGTALAAVERIEEAARDFRKAIEIDPVSAEPWRQLGNLYYEIDRLEEAEGALRKATEIDPSSAPTWATLGYVNYHLERFQQAEHASRKAIEIDPSSAAAWGTLGITALRIDNLEEAEQALRKTADLDPADGPSRVLLGFILGITNRAEEGRTYLNEAIGFEEPQAWGLGALVLAKTYGDLRRAKELARRAIVHAPEDMRIRFLAAQVFAECGQWAEALEQIADTVEKQPTWLSDILANVTEILIAAIAAGHAGRVLELLRDRSLGELLEPLLHAVRLELGESLDPLPTEIMDAVEDVRRRIATKRESSISPATKVKASLGGRAH